MQLRPNDFQNVRQFTLYDLGFDRFAVILPF